MEYCINTIITPDIQEISLSQLDKSLSVFKVPNIITDKLSDDKWVNNYLILFFGYIIMLAVNLTIFSLEFDT